MNVVLIRFCYTSHQLIIKYMVWVLLVRVVHLFIGLPRFIFPYVFVNLPLFVNAAVNYLLLCIFIIMLNAFNSSLICILFLVICICISGYSKKKSHHWCVYPCLMNFSKSMPHFHTWPLVTSSFYKLSIFVRLIHLLSISLNLFCTYFRHCCFVFPVLLSTSSIA